MSFWRTIASNQLILVAFASWAAAQIIKTLLTMLTRKKFVPERLFGAGGMPSSHSALVCSLAVSMARSQGFSSPLFALSFIFAGVVMYDAMGVRREAGEHAKLLNRMVFDFNDLNKDLSQLFSAINEQNDDLIDEHSEEIIDELAQDGASQSEHKLKEYLGHTPLEVLGGALLGLLIGTVWPLH